ncbi:MAG: alpha/beta hydrolase [Agarilytica sp.]
MQKEDVCAQSDPGATLAAQCHTLVVKENHDDSNSRDLTLRILRLPSIQESQKAPIFFIAGGPGQASGDLLERFRHQFPQLRIHHDFIFVDQRGTGKSEALECDIDLMPHLDKDAAALEQLNIEASKACLNEYTADLRYYATPFAVKDLEQVRKHFGYDKVNLWGGSYGTRVVLEYLRRFPNSIAASVMDGLAPIQIQLPTYAERDATQSLNSLLQNCETQKACQSAFPQLTQRWKTHLQLRKKSPVTQQLQHPRTQKPVNVYIDDQVLSSWIHLILYSRELSPILPLAIDLATKENYSQLFSIFALGREDMPTMISEGMQATVLCAEDYVFHKENHDKHTQNNTLEDSDLLNLPPRTGFDNICKLLPKSVLDKTYFSSVESNIPSLFLSGQFDPATPPRWAESLLPGFNQAKHIVVPGGHHIVSQNSCIANIISEFFSKPEDIQALNDTCVSHIKPTAYFIDASGPDMKAAIENTGVKP